MKIGNSSKIRARRAAAAATAAEAQNSKAAILARKRERWRVQKEVHDAQQQFRGAGRRLGDGAATRNDRPAPSLPGAVDSPSPPPPHARRAARAPPRARSALSHLEDNDILTQLTERIASRLKVELRHEVENAQYDDATKKDVSTKIESFLQNELQQHTCPVCFEPMLPPARSPMLLFPCGHTFCEQCINHQKKVAKHQCPLCRAKIERVAVNHSLRQLMDTFLTKQKAVASGDATVNTFSAETSRAGGSVPPPAAAPSLPRGGADKGTEYLQKCRALKIRGRILKNEREDTKRELRQIEKQVAGGRYVMDTLLREEEAALEKLRAAQAALDLVREHKEKHVDKVEQLERARVESTRKLKLIETTIGTIERDADKAYVLLQNFRPGAKVEL